MVTSLVTFNLPDLSHKTPRPGLYALQGLDTKPPEEDPRAPSACQPEQPWGLRMTAQSSCLAPQEAGGGAANCSRNSLATLRANCPAPENAVNPAKGLGGPRAQAFARQEPQGGWGGGAYERKISKLRKAGTRVPINTMSVLLQVGSGPGVSALEGYVPLSLQATQ